MGELTNPIYKVYTEQPVNPLPPTPITVVQQQLAFGGVAIGTILCMTAFIREVRLLIQACKS